MWMLSLFLTLLLQTPAPNNRVVVGFIDGEELVVENPEFFGFIHGPGRSAVLTYRQKNLHGQMSMNAISRIEFGKYQKGRPFAITVTLRTGETLEVQSERDNFVTLRGTTNRGTVIIKHPDPVSAPLKLTTGKPNRKKDLTIQYLEFPTSSE
jgi:hypothetical protein